MHLVVVDPSRTIHRKIATDLEKDGAIVDAFDSSDRALEFVREQTSVEVVLTSLELEPMSGLELCWSLRTLTSNDRLLHIIVMSGNASEQVFAEALDSGADDFLLKPFGREALRARLRAAARIMLLQRQLSEQARTDALTGLLNRRAFVSRMGECRSDLDSRLPIALAIFDIDHFKRVNDTFGHDIGDVVLKQIGPVASVVSPIVARLGGEEFAMAFPAASAELGAEWCDETRAAIAAREFPGPQGSFHITCSFGVSEWNAGETLSEALKRADIALYEAKKTGRNRVVVKASSPALENPAALAKPERMTA